MANNLTVVDNTALLATINEQDVAQQLKAIATFQAVIKNQFKDNHHYGIIPGTGKKPTLLQPGAQTICTLLGLQPQYEILDKQEDYTKGFFSYTIRCRLIGTDGCIHADQIASANTKETKWERDWKYNEDGTPKGVGNMANTVLKMAQKRALVGAALFIGCLSEVFTQDLDDIDLSDLNGNKAGANSYESKQERKISEAQAKRLFAIDKGHHDIVKRIISDYGYSNSRDILVKDYDTICKEIEEAVEGL